MVGLWVIRMGVKMLISMKIIVGVRMGQGQVFMFFVVFVGVGW